MAGVTLILDEATPLLERVRSAAAARGLALVGARAGAQLVRDHLFGLNAQRHRFGRNYYAQAARSVHSRAVPQGAAISITQTGFRQRLQGGIIRAKPGKALTIPEADEAHGRRAGEFSDLHLAKYVNPRTGELQAALVRNLSTPISIRRRTLKDGTIKTTISAGAQRGGEIMYWLVKEVDQKPDPTVLPHEEHLAARVTDAIRTRMLRLTHRSSGTTPPPAE